MKALVVTIPFADYAVGEQITEKDAIKAALAASPHCVVPVNVKPPAEPDAKAEPKSEPAKSAALPAVKSPNAV